ncbi:MULTISPECIES: hypothetical protein [unclassified Thioalkalivibrio]|uniref:hypothetical protein n=1 Tax=unclassified Thioalkalivibrio TaxID=2621013 RepID=UPI0012DD6B25|nr:MULTISPECIES: hypothetical protein [unclassified Thioalkalivibrio]
MDWPETLPGALALPDRIEKVGVLFPVFSLSPCRGEVQPQCGEHGQERKQHGGLFRSTSIFLFGGLSQGQKAASDPDPPRIKDPVLAMWRLDRVDVTHVSFCAIMDCTLAMLSGGSRSQLVLKSRPSLVDANLAFPLLYLEHSQLKAYSKRLD